MFTRLIIECHTTSIRQECRSVGGWPILTIFLVNEHDETNRDHVKIFRLIIPTTGDLNHQLVLCLSLYLTLCTRNHDHITKRITDCFKCWVLQHQSGLLRYSGEGVALNEIIISLQPNSFTEKHTVGRK